VNKSVANQQFVYRNQAAQPYNFTVKAGTTAIHTLAIAAASQPANAIDITSCVGAPANWTKSGPATFQGRKACLYTAQTAAADIKPNTSSSAFGVSASTPPGAGAAFNQWVLVTNFTRTPANAGQSAPGALTTPVANVQLTDAMVVGAAVPLGTACPAGTPLNHSAAALSTKRLVVCGVKWGSDAFTPNSTDSRLLGTFAVQDTLDSGAVPAGATGTLAAPIALANYSNALIGPNAGAANLFGLLVQSKSTASPSSSQPLLMTNFTVLCMTTYTVDIKNGNDTTGTGTCSNPWKHIKKATDVAASGESIQINPGTYDAAAGETFPVAVPDGVDVTSDLNSLLNGLKNHKFDAVKIIGNVNLGSNARLTGLWLQGTTTAANLSKVRYSILINTPSTSPPSIPVCLDVTGSGVDVQSVLAIACGYGMKVESGGSAKVRTSYFVKNVYGVNIATAALTNGSADLGTTGSLGLNTFCSGINADIWNQAVGTILTPVTTQAVGNRWDHVPPSTSNVPLSGADIVNPPLFSTVNAASATLASNDPTSQKLCA
jgi:hypothetical protein